MTKLYDLGNNTYRVQTHAFGLREGSLRDVCQFMVFDLDIEYSQIEFALVEMNRQRHDGADFGILGRFIFSFSTKEIKNVG